MTRWGSLLLSPLHEAEATGNDPSEPTEVTTSEIVEEEPNEIDNSKESNIPVPEEEPEGGGVEFEVKEAQEEELLSGQLEDLAEDFGEEYDPTLDLGRFQLPHLDKLINHGDGKNRVPMLSSHRTRRTF